MERSSALRMKTWIALRHAARGELGRTLMACTGIFVSLLVTDMVCRALQLSSTALPVLLAPVGASAVLVFTAPSSPLSQPWPVIAGSTISAAFGIGTTRFMGDPAWAVAIAVSGAILVTSVLRCPHPPGGAAALLAVVGGQSIQAQGYWFAVIPIGLNAAILTGTAIVIHRIMGQTYPYTR